MQAKPGHAQLHAIEILHYDRFQAPRQLVPRHCASVHLRTFCYHDSFSATYQICTATRVMLNKICTRTAKTRAIPSLHRDNFSTKEPGLCPVLTSGNTTSLYCRAVMLKHQHITTSRLHLQLKPKHNSKEHIYDHQDNLILILVIVSTNTQSKINTIIFLQNDFK
jgi:hypothetical protein